MPQITGYPGAGIRLSKSVLILCGFGDPNTSAQVDVQNAGVGSLFLRQDAPDTTHCLYVATTAGIPTTVSQNGTPAVWTAK
jgi:hypothetical protein